MKSRRTAQFRKMVADLPEQIQEQTREAYRQFRQDPSYPSLRFKKVHPKLPIYSVRISKGYRAVGQLYSTRLKNGLSRKALQALLRKALIVFPKV